ncbi:YHS domain-containing protein [Chryseobacterium sp. RU37D]|uniref:YHS domain-containing protein n=1 Tax=Chryseobacterium sp. RU37D TaxID=1907397 RepID=UPI0009568827|nr:YHS domain-containing protein [Chryseobacterium sp. RU37D]SIQ03763.1 YHS domain-containing protein [Chryseobacterium sp. RU37D]
MKSKIILAASLSVSLLACAQGTPKVNHKKHTVPSNSRAKPKFVNAEDPICNMPTEPYMKDTAIYKNKMYGFCSTYCRDVFKKNPEKYAQK